MSYGTRHTTTAGVRRMGSNLFGTCSTGAGTMIKIVDLPDFDVLVEGVTIHVKFEYGNAVSAPALKVGPTSAVSIRRNGSSEGRWAAGSVVSFTYDGAFWQQNDFYDTTGYSNTYSLGQSGDEITLYENGSAKNTVTVPIPYVLSQTYGTYNAPVGMSNQDVIPPEPNPAGIVGWNIDAVNGLSVLRLTAAMVLDNGKGHWQIGNAGTTSHSYSVTLWYLYFG